MLMRFGNQKSSPLLPRGLFVGVTILLLLFGLAPAHHERAAQSSAICPPAVGDEDGGVSPAKNFSCLPKDVRADEAVSYGMKGKSILTVEQKLAEMKARCRRGRLVDARGREIRFFRSSCWGNPPADYQEIQQRKNAELAKLKKRYTVIVFGCNPMIQ